MATELQIDIERCKGCALCVRACPKKILRIAESRRNRQGYHPAEMIDVGQCIACASCALTCPDVCIIISK